MRGRTHWQKFSQPFDNPQYHGQKIIAQVFSPNFGSDAARRIPKTRALLSTLPLRPSRACSLHPEFQQGEPSSLIYILLRVPLEEAFGLPFRTPIAIRYVQQ